MEDLRLLEKTGYLVGSQTTAILSQSSDSTTKSNRNAYNTNNSAIAADASALKSAVLHIKSSKSKLFEMNGHIGGGSAASGANSRSQARVGEFSTATAAIATAGSSRSDAVAAATGPLQVS